MRRFAISIVTFACFYNLLNAQDDTTGVSPEQSGGIQWKSLLLESAYFMSLEDAFRWGTQQDTRTTGGGKFFQGYARSIDNLHGWADGDPFFTNYVLHPMQGGITGFMLVQHDPKFKMTEFGKNRAYWKSRLRGAAFAWAYSELFEIGPISEATVGHTQAYFAQQGFVDHVITPTIGLAWMIGEDAADKYLVERIEAHTQNGYVKAVARSVLNPTRSMANILRFQMPWHRDTRPGVFQQASPSTVMASGLTPNGAVTGSDGEADPPASSVHGAAPFIASSRPPDLTAVPVPKLEVAANYNYFQLSAGKRGSQGCNGGGATAGLSLNSSLAIIADVGGCKMMSPGVNISGDSTYYLAGPRFALRKWQKWTPYVELLAGGNKLTTETMYPDKKPPQSVIDKMQPWVAHAMYTSADQTNSWAIELGAGLDYEINHALGFRVVEVDDLHTWARDLNDRHYANNVRMSTGLVLRFGTW